MTDLPIRYFDTHNHGDIMSYYTNDIATLRQMISQSFPQLLISAVTVITVFSIMLYYSIWLAAVVVLGVVCMVLVAVSYTHLDVYKRQDRMRFYRQRPGPGRDGARRKEKAALRRKGRILGLSLIHI